MPYKRNMRYIFAINLIIVLFLSNLMPSFSAEDNTIWVDDDYHYPSESDGSLSKPYATIQAAINVAVSGDTIKVLPGIYDEDIVIDKSVSIRTDDVENTIIMNNQKTAYLVDIKADNISIEGFTLIDETNTSHRKAVFHITDQVKDIVISGNNIPSTILSRAVRAQYAENIVIRENNFNNTNGVQLENCVGCSIADNTITDTSIYPAIRLFDCEGIQISDNTINNAMHGIYIQSSSRNTIRLNKIGNNTNTGVSIQGGEQNYLHNNTVGDNGVDGIKLTCDESNIENNTICRNTIGITIDSDNSIIKNNDIKNNQNYGIYISTISTANIIYENTIIAEKDVILALDHGNNQWYYQGVGNYWSDYLGPDNDEDGIGEVAYNKNNLDDQYPTGKFQKHPIISDPQPGHLSEDVDLHPTLSVFVEDPENERIDVSFYYMLDNVSYLIETVKNVESGSRASIAFYSTVQGQNAVYTYLGAGYDYIGVWYVTASDIYSTNTSQFWVFSTLHVPIDNDPPIARISGDDVAETDEPIVLDASSSSDPDGTISFIHWSFDDGTSIINDYTPAHVYSEAGTYNISLIVIDDNGSSSSVTKKINVQEQKNDPPVANCNGPYYADANSFLTFSSVGSYDPDQNDVLQYLWTFGDGNTSVDENPTYKYGKGGNYTVTLTVTDAEGLSYADSIYAIINQPKQESPGFEIVFIIFSAVIVLMWRRNKKQ